MRLALSNVSDADRRPIFIGLNQALAPGVMGYPIVSSTSLKASALTDENLIFGDPSTVTLGRWGGIVLAASPHTGSNFAQLRTSFRAVMAHDVAVLEPNALIKGLNVDVTGAIS